MKMTNWMNWKNFLITGMAMFSLFSFSVARTEAAYQLNPEVKDATPALKEAAAIGVLKHETPSLQQQENKDAILVMSFGTTFKDSREKTIEATVKSIQQAHPATKVVTAFTSHIIIDRIAKKEGIHYPTPEEALESLKADGYTRVALATLDVIPGMEYAYDKAVYEIYKNDFKKMTLGTPLMYWQGQEGQKDDVTDTIEALKTEFPKQKKDDAILIMAHGTPQVSNAYYSVLQEKINALGMRNVYVYTVEGWPSLDNVVPKLKENHIKHVTLIPLMMVAGDHANNDMAGKEKDSHKSRLEAAGFQVDAYLHGIGENQAIRDLYVSRANEAWDALVKE
jgi:sirohydrochlorin cobaltochelatase